MNTCSRRLPATALAALWWALVFPAHANTETLETLETHYTVTIQTPKGGQLVRRLDAQGAVHNQFSYRDNGRGPDMQEDYTRAADGTVLSYAVNGKSTFGGEIKDRFERRNDQVRWASTVDSGEVAASADAMYLPVEYSPDWLAWLVRAVWVRPGHTAPALPGGRFTVERVGGTALRASLPPGANEGAGGTVQVGLYALLGADLTPQYVWLREAGEQPLFALVYPGWKLVEKGFEDQADKLLELQKSVQEGRLRSLVAKLSQPLPGLTVIRHVRWFDAAAARMRGPADVTLFNGRIGAVLAAGEGPSDAEQSIDGTGKTLLPGLFDMHGHLYADGGLLHLAAGVTTVRDMGNHNDELWSLKQRFDSGTELGPRIVPLGFIEGQSAFSSRFGILAPTLADAQRAVDWYAARGYRQVKLYNSIKPEWTQPLAAYAHQRGLRVAGHVPAFMRAEQAVRAGYDEISHVNQVMLNFFLKPEHDTRTLLRFTLVGDEAYKLDLDGPRVKRFLALLRKQGTVVDPTLGTFEAMFNQRNGQPNPNLKMVADHLPVAVRRAILSNSMEVNDANALRYKKSYAQMVALVGRMHKAGVPLLAGTDDFPGFALHRELELFVQAGIPAAQVLQLATHTAATYAGTLHDSGSIEPGKRADLVLVDGDPSQRIQDIRRVSLVLTGGKALAPDAAFESLGIKPFLAAAPVAVKPAAVPR